MERIREYLAMVGLLLRQCFPFLLNERGAVTVTNILAGVDALIADVEATADADTTATIPHGLGGTPQDISYIPLLQAPAAVSAWAATTIDGTNVVLTKGTGVGSGSAGAQVRVTIKRPHSIGA